MRTTSAAGVCRALNRVAVACSDELIVLESAARELGGERGERLGKQAARRVAFGRELAAGVLALGGVPKRKASYRARLSKALGPFRALGSKLGPDDRYLACALAAEKTANSYVLALSLVLPPEMRLGLERQSAEASYDAKELRWLRWGGSLSEHVRSEPGTGR